MELTEKKISSELKYKGKVIDVYSDTVLLENGKETGRDVVRHPGGVCVAAITEDNQVYFVKQFRYPHGKVLLELPAGKLEWGENHFECGKRELLEETGCTAEEFTYLGCLLPTPAYDTEVIHMYMATGLKYVEQNLDDDEFLEVVHMPYTELKKAIFTGEICDAKTQAAFLKADYILNNIKKK